MHLRELLVDDGERTGHVAYATLLPNLLRPTEEVRDVDVLMFFA